MGSKSDLLRTLAAVSGVKSATLGVRSSVPKWRRNSPSLQFATASQAADSRIMTEGAGRSPTDGFGASERQRHRAAIRHAGPARRSRPRYFAAAMIFESPFASRFESFRARSLAFLAVRSHSRAVAHVPRYSVTFANLSRNIFAAKHNASFFGYDSFLIRIILRLKLTKGIGMAGEASESGTLLRPAKGVMASSAR
jgi:hypothetical protein